MFPKRFVSLCLALVLLLMARVGATASTPTVTPAATSAPTSITVTDALGRQVTFAQAPQRIVVTGKALFMVADAIYLFPEASSRVVAIGKTAQGKLDFIPVIDPDYKSKTILDSQAGPEQIAASKPDVVLLKSSNAESLGKPLDSLGIPVVYVDFETPEQYARDLMTLGQLFQNEARAKQLIAFFQERTDRVTKALADLKEDQKPRVLLMYYTDQGGSVAFNVPPLTFIQSMDVQIGGGQPVWKDAQPGKGWAKVTLEQIAAWDADQVYIVAYFNNVKDVINKLKADPQWQALHAVKQGRLYGFPGDYYSWDQPDPRWILGLTWLAAKIHPDRFMDLDMQKEIRSFYQDLYNLDDAAYQKIIQPNLTGDLP
jgi:iron complex transport system substrate-binding protein